LPDVGHVELSYFVGVGCTPYIVPTPGRGGPGLVICAGCVCGAVLRRAPSHFKSCSACICGSSAEQESHSRKEPQGKCGSEGSAQHPQEIVDPRRLDARLAIELINLVRVDQLYRVRCGACRRGRVRSALGNGRNRPSRSRGRKQTSAPAFVIESLLIRTRRGDHSRSSLWRLLRHGVGRLLPGRCWFAHLGACRGSRIALCMRLFICACRLLGFLFVAEPPFFAAHREPADLAPEQFPVSTPPT